jgi:hypothetical protein
MLSGCISRVSFQFYVPTRYSGKEISSWENGETGPGEEVIKKKKKKE